mgnify:CR=1 FL=1
MREELLALLVITSQITILGLVYFVIFKQDSNVLITIASILAGLAGYIFGKRAVRRNVKKQT